MAVLFFFVCFCFFPGFPDLNERAGFNPVGNFLHFGKQGCSGRGVNTELPGGKGEDGILHFRELTDFSFYFGGTVGTVDIL